MWLGGSYIKACFLNDSRHCWCRQTGFDKSYPPPPPHIAADCCSLRSQSSSRGRKGTGGIQVSKAFQAYAVPWLSRGPIPVLSAATEMEPVSRISPRLNSSIWPPFPPPHTHSVIFLMLLFLVCACLIWQEWGFTWMLAQLGVWLRAFCLKSSNLPDSYLYPLNCI